MDKQEQLIEHLKPFLGDEFIPVICGDYGAELSELEDGDNKYVMITNEDGDAYIDWYYEEFDVYKLKNFADRHQQIDLLNIEFKELSNRILLALGCYDVKLEKTENMKKEKKRVVCCGKVLKTPFCPDCGKPMAEAEKEKQSLFPSKFTTYLHGDKHDEQKEKIVESLGLSVYEEHPATNAIMGCDYEVQIDWIVFEDGNIVIDKVNGFTVLHKNQF